MPPFSGHAILCKQGRWGRGALPRTYVSVVTVSIASEARQKLRIFHFLSPSPSTMVMTSPAPASSGHVISNAVAQRMQKCSRNAVAHRMQKMHMQMKCSCPPNAENAECSLECTIMRSNAMICVICNICNSFCPCKKCAWAKTTRIFGQEPQDTQALRAGL